MRCLVTGGAGFIGSHLCDALLGAGHSVVALDDLSTGRRENVAHLEANPAFSLVAGSVLDAERTDRLVADCDRVYHLASTVGVQLVVEHPVRSIETIAQGAAVVLRSADRHRRRTLVTSSSEVYGKSDGLPFREDADLDLGHPKMGRWAYGCAKALGEFLAMAYWTETKLPVTCARLFNTVGPRQTGQYGMVLPRLVGQALRGEPLTVFGDGEQTRCFAHVADVVGGILALMECREAEGEIVNLGSDEEVSINELARRVIRAAGSRSPIVHVPYERAYSKGFDDMRRRVPCIEKAARLVGYAPSRGLDDIIRDIVAGMRG